MPITVMITEDDLLSRSILVDLLEDNFPDVKIIGLVETVKDSIIFLENHKTDLLFLDIELPDGKGFDILRSLQPLDFAVIVTTSYIGYAQEYSSFKILSSIVKPLTYQNLEKAMMLFQKKCKKCI
jgi:two-component system, LytTR family, response regulator